MSFRERIKEHLIDFEGLRHEPYKCTANRNTIGVGHNMDANPLPRSMQAYLEEHGRLELAQILELLEKDIDKAELGARTLFESFNDYTEARKVALVDLVFNLGVGGFSKFHTTLAAIRHNQWDAAAAALGNSKWARQVGRRATEVIKLIKEG